MDPDQRFGHRRVGLRPQSTGPEHERMQVYLSTDAFEIAGVAISAHTGNRLYYCGNGT